MDTNRPNPDIIHTDPEDSTVPCGPIIEGPIPVNPPPDEVEPLIPDGRMTRVLGRRRHLSVMGTLGSGHTLRWGRRVD